MSKNYRNNYEDVDIAGSKEYIRRRKDKQKTLTRKNARLPELSEAVEMGSETNDMIDKVNQASKRRHRRLSLY